MDSNNDVMAVDAHLENERHSKSWAETLTQAVSAALVCLSLAVVIKDTFDYVSGETKERPVTRI